MTEDFFDCHMRYFDRHGLPPLMQTFNEEGLEHIRSYVEREMKSMGHDVTIAIAHPPRDDPWPCAQLELISEGKSVIKVPANPIE